MERMLKYTQSNFTVSTGYEKGCKSGMIFEEKAKESVAELAKLIAEEYLKEEHYSVIDRLATSINPDGVKLALYEILRGLSRDRIPRNIFSIIENLLADLDREECRESALSAAKSIAILALSHKIRRGE